MAEQFLQLSRDDRRDVLAIAAEKTGRPIHLRRRSCARSFPSFHCATRLWDLATVRLSSRTLRGLFANDQATLSFFSHRRSMP